jgi:hypothetical protein
MLYSRATTRGPLRPPRFPIGEHLEGRAAPRDMPKNVAIVQSNYVPWKGYFDLIGSVDEFILLDDLQYTRRDWRNRNQIKTMAGLFWLSIPVEVKGRAGQAIKDVRVVSARWASKHWRTLQHHYARARAFEPLRDPVAEMYRDAAHLESLSLINHLFITRICRLLGIRTRLTWSMDYASVPGKSERLLSLCLASGATHYVSGPMAKSYLDLAIFERARIPVTFFDYADYRPYPQLYPPFTHNVSILDLLLSEGHEAARFLKSSRTPAAASAHGA